MPTTYVIAGETVTAHANEPAHHPEECLVVRSAGDLATSDFPTTRLVAIWNALPRAKKIAAFKDRDSAVRRLWAAFETLPVAGAASAALTAKTRAQGRERSADKKQPPRAETKQARMITLLKRPGGATLETLAKATGWQRHTVRGAIAGALKKRLGLKVVARRDKDGARVYRIAGVGR